MNKIMFQVVKYMFHVLAHKFLDVVHMFLDLEYKITQERITFSKCTK